MSSQDKYNFLYPYNSYRGQVKPENLVFNSNLQEFAHKVSYICNLQTGGKIPSKRAYKQIERLWKELKQSRTGIPQGIAADFRLTCNQKLAGFLKTNSNIHLIPR